MAGNQAQKKNKKTKKKSDSTTLSDSDIQVQRETFNCSTGTNKNSVAMELLNLETQSDIEVQSSEKSLEDTNVTGSKKNKKSKKKNKEETKVVEPQTVENEPNQSLLNFTKNGIHLLNHPEISVTFTSAETGKVGESEKQIQQELKNDETKKENDTNNSNKKKKKNKKKGNNNSLTDVPVSSNESTDTVVTPTYTKVVTSDNTCVLVVNNENLAAASKAYGNIEEKKENNKVRFSVPNDKKEVLITSNLNSQPNIHLSNAVSIFPILQNVKENTPDNSPKLPLNLETMQGEVKKDSENVTENPQSSEAPTKAELKAERRAKQEAQRAAKLAKTMTKVESDSGAQPQNVQKVSKETVCPNKTSNSASAAEKLSKSNVNEKDSLRKVRLFSHLPEHKQVDTTAEIPPAILEVGSQHNKGIICGSNSRCISLLAALKEVIQDFKPQPGKNLCRELESSIQTYLSFLNNCRPISVSMANAVKFLKHQINHLPTEIDDDKAKGKLCDFIENFVKEEILLAKEAIGYSAAEKIVDGDVILVFSHSSLVKHVLFKAYNESKRFRVVVADSRPKLEGLEMLRCLVKQGLHCSYIPINAVSYVMKEVSKVIIGAHALLANGCVMSRLGSKQIALVASSYSVPVLVCCETYKFCERVLTDSFVHNELGEPNDISESLIESKNSLKSWQNISSLQLLNLLYDVTPSDLISMVVTEKGVLPCTSVPVVLRVRYAGLHE